MKIKEFVIEKFDLIKVIITAVMTAAATVIFHFVEAENYVKLIVYVAIYLFIGYETIFGMIKEFIKTPFNEDFLMVVATVGAFVLGEYFEAVAVMLLFAVGELFEDYAEERSERAITALAELMPEEATILVDGKEKKIKSDDVAVGDKLLVKTGDRIVCDGVVIDGAATVDNSMLTGESKPISALNGNLVNSGAVIGSGYLVVEVKAVSAKSSANKILELVKEESEKKAGKEKFITKFAKIYTPIVIATAVLVAALPPIFGASFAEWVKKALNLLVISCPCALVISVPLAYFSGVGNAFSKGIIVKGGAALEKAAQIDAILFDKTGTLTSGRFEVKAVYPEENKNEILKTAATLEKYSNHPIAVAVLSAAEGETDEVPDIEEIAGMGLSSKKARLLVGNAKLMERAGLNIESDDTCDTVVYVAKNGALLGKIYIGDSVKEGANEVIDGLIRSGKKVAMLTGDRISTAEKVAAELGISDYRAELMPEDKKNAVEEYSKTKRVAFVGDGINDAPSLAASHLAIAMGSGTDVAALCSDVIITDDNVKKIPHLLKIAKKTARIVKENIYGSIAVKVCVLVLSVVISVPMWAAILADVGVMAIACLNSMRLAARRSPKSNK